MESERHAKGLMVRLQTEAQQQRHDLRELFRKQVVCTPTHIKTRAGCLMMMMMIMFITISARD